jgi:outer membrane protein TolC
MQRTTTKLLFLLIVLQLATAGALVWASTEKMAVADIQSIQVLDLDTAAKIALAESPTLAAAAQRVEQARQLVNQARGAYWPNLLAKGSVNRVNQSENQYQTNLATPQAINP